MDDKFTLSRTAYPLQIAGTMVLLFYQYCHPQTSSRSNYEMPHYPGAVRCHPVSRIINHKVNVPSTRNEELPTRTLHLQYRTQFHHQWLDRFTDIFFDQSLSWSVNLISIVLVMRTCCISFHLQDCISLYHV